MRTMTGLIPTRFHDFAVIAEILGVTLTHHTNGPTGYYDHRTKTISTRRGLTAAMYRSTLAHELGHAHHQDAPSTPGKYTRSQERRADRFAVQILFTEEHFKEAFAWCGSDVAALAEELECSQHHVLLYMTLNGEKP